MHIAEIMTPDPIVVGPDCPLDDAIHLFEQCGFRHLPVVEDGALIGMVSDRDLSLATGWVLADYRRTEDSDGPQAVREIMRSPVLSLSTLDTPEDVAAMIVGKRIGAVPIMNGKKLAGIVTETNLLEAFREEKLATDLAGDHAITVSEMMTTDVDTLDPDQFLDDALELIVEKGYRHVPIVEKGRVLGMISDRDLRFGMGQEMISDMSAQETGRLEISRTPLSALMAVDVVSVDSRCTLTQAIDVMLAHHFSALPVVDGSKLVGILTQTDVLKHVVRNGPVAS
ncbi:MAG: CBS domain-containing protein [Planctomycetes bacterium]|nr:CBS domain-containing protein [Planctomycetota bacterium]MCB9905463.1 CBS domain-containing protein [Planctomycetota bacterium]